MRAAALGGLILIGAAGFAVWRGARASEDRQPDDGMWNQVGEAVKEVASNVGNLIMGWNETKIPARYAGAIMNAENANGIPRNLLARLLWQESRYNPEAVSPAGAVGIAQFMPATAAELGIDPLDPAQAIPAAARYVAALYRQFGTWREALAAYNWGQGNLRRKGIDAAPLETRLYYSQILADVGVV